MIEPEKIDETKVTETTEEIQPMQPEEKEKPFDEFVRKYGVPSSIIVAGLVIAASVFFSLGNGKQGSGQTVNNTNPDSNVAGATQNSKIDVSADDDPVLGSTDAEVTIIEFSDFQCPFCRSFWRDTLPQIKEKYIDSGKVKFVYRDFPLSSIHPSAQIAAEAANCAGDQGKYWEMHDKMFTEQDKLGPNTVTFTKDDLKKWAGEIGLNANTFNSCVDSGRHTEEVQKDFADGRTAGITGTPGFSVNGHLISGALPYSAFEQAIEEALKE